MITRDAIDNCWERFRSSLSVHDREQARDLKELAKELLKERDEALQYLAEKEREKEALLKHALDQRDAYREVARLSGHTCHTLNCKCGEEVDAEAARILEKRKGEKP